MSCKYDYKIEMSRQTSHSLILKRITPGSKVLEFGPATGYMTRYLKEELGCSITCVEIDPVAAAQASKYSTRMIIADLDLLEWPKGLSGESFDHLLFADVIEHLKNPWKVVRTGVQFLKPDGTIIISVPNIGHSSILMELLDGRFEYGETGLLDESHLRFFTRKSLLDLLEYVGLWPIDLTATLTAPEDTEFRQTYRALPKPLQDLFQNRKDAHVYQYIVVAKRKEEAEESGECLREFTLNSSSPCKEYIQVYWSDQGMAETGSVRVPLTEQEGFQQYEVLLPERAGDDGFLRIDPTNFPSYVEIKEIELLTENNKVSGHCIARWSAETGFNNLSLSIDTFRVSDQTYLKLFCTTDDPQVILSGLPPLKQQTMLRVNMLVSRNWYEAAAEKVLTQQDELTGLRGLLDSRAAEITSLRQLLDSQTTELRELNAALKISREELDQTRSKAHSYEQQLIKIESSAVWRTVYKLRKFVLKILKPVKKLRGLIPGGYAQTLIPLDNIKQDKEFGFWEAVGEDPKFLLSGPFPDGWCEIRFKAASKVPLKIKLYFDRGRGFNEIESLLLEVVRGERLQDYRQIFYLDNSIQQVRLDPGDFEGRFAINSLTFCEITRVEILVRAFIMFFKRQGYSWKSMKLGAIQVGRTIRRGGLKGLWRWAKKMIAPEDDYGLWLRYHALTEPDKENLKENSKKLALKPVFSILVPVYNVDERWLRSCLDSVLDQIYPYWELCIADDASTDHRVHKVLKEYAGKDARIKVVYRENNGHISAASNSALELATGDYIGLLDHDDVLAADALLENALLINQHPDADMIYSDEDKIGEDGVRHSPFFKPDWSPDNLLGQMYTCHFGVYRTNIVHQVGGFRLGYEGSQDHDLALRVTEITDKIYHIPKILYHWRTIPESTAASTSTKSYAVIAGEKAIRDALNRRGEEGWVQALENYPGHYLVHFPAKGQPLVSILIPTRDMAGLLGKCLNTIFSKTTYTNYEVLVIDNGSVKAETKQLFTKWQQLEPERFKVLYLDIPFNYSRLNNEAVKHAKGELIVLLNNDVEIITPNWLEEMAGQAMRPSIGAVGAKLLYSDQTIQHTGVTLGIGGVGDHGHRGYGAEEPGYFGRLLIVADYAAVTGACLMVKRELFNQVDGMEEKLSVAFNDVDFCLKLLDKGYYNVVLPQVKLYHFESKSRGYDNTPEKMSRLMSEIEYMKKQWGSLLERDPFYNPNLTLEREDYGLRMSV